MCCLCLFCFVFFPPALLPLCWPCVLASVSVCIRRRDHAFPGLLRWAHLKVIISSTAALYPLRSSSDHSVTHSGNEASGQTLNSSVLVLCDYSLVLMLCFPVFHITICQPAHLNILPTCVFSATILSPLPASQPSDQSPHPHPKECTLPSRPSALLLAASPSTPSAIIHHLNKNFVLSFSNLIPESLHLSLFLVF